MLSWAPEISFYSYPMTLSTLGILPITWSSFSFSCTKLKFPFLRKASSLSSDKFKTWMTSAAEHHSSFLGGVHTLSYGQKNGPAKFEK